MSISSTNPATGTILRTFKPLTDKEIEEKLRIAAATFASYRATSFAERAAMMSRAGEIVTGNRRELAEIATLEMGKTLKSALEEVDKCAWVCRFYAEQAEGYLASEEVAGVASRSYVRYEPVGAVLAVMPWNFPYWQVFRFLAPALMAGNVGLLKHASCVPQCALKIEEITLQAGFPKGAFQTLLISASQVEGVLKDPRVKAATLTGSEAAGIKVAVDAASQMKKVVMELGGSDPFIVMPSADLEQALTAAVKSRTLNNGQSCINAKRFIVAESIADQFEAQFVARMAALKIGDPMQETTDIGPLSTPDNLADLEELVEAGIKAGAKVLTGGKRLEGAGNFYPPTVLTNIKEDSPVYREELFGPVACIYRARDVGDAIRIANDTRFGLGASAWTNDPAEQQRFIDEIESGMVFINRMVISDPRLPFGGTKMSGHGRELSAHGIREFTNIKAVSIQDAGTGSK